MNSRSEKDLMAPDTSESLEKAFTQLYPEIKIIAQAQLSRLQPGKTTTATVLVNECFLKLHGKEKLNINSEKHFYCLIAKCMKQFLIDEIRGKNRSKRDVALKTSIISLVVGTQNDNVKLIEVTHAIDHLEKIDGELAELVNLHCFGGFTFEELSQILNKSKRQLFRKWQIAKTMIMSLLEENDKNN